MTSAKAAAAGVSLMSQSAFVRGFIDDGARFQYARRRTQSLNPRSCAASSMTRWQVRAVEVPVARLNPRSCAASSMTASRRSAGAGDSRSQSAFVRGFIDDVLL